MSVNHKLTNAIRGRSVGSVSQEEGKLHITFGDGSVMTIKTGQDAVAADISGATVDHAEQDVAPPALLLKFAGGSSWTAPLAEATSSVMLRNAAGKLEYVD